ncbi:hypothetical protein B0H16DRAFT_1689818 [Mycena metata]|uniref:Uncharacterized protein n=1 Tax=Mycena metata TaxID=1033252 RepID=A0AAD7J417_9AGAR|nr:hypothetical protein B0H16DRAFT_1689818 [Mycena metata]
MGPAAPVFVPKVPTHTFLKWTFGRGSVIWKIWPAILLHTLFAAAIVYTWVATGRKLEIPNVILTVMGVVIGFVISYRAMSGYDRYWMGRTAWTDVIRNARTMGRLIWYHVPLRLTPAAPGTGTDPRTPHELGKVMAEKRMALDLVEAFAVALKHHLRGEVGICYEDLYDLFTDPSNPHPTVGSALPASLPAAAPAPAPTPPVASTLGTSTGTDATLKPTGSTHASKRPSAAATASLDSPNSPSAQSQGQTPQGSPGHTSHTSLHQPLLPAMQPEPEEGVLRRVAPDVIPFAGVFSGVGGWLSGFWTKGKDIDSHRTDRSSRMQRRMRTWTGPIHPSGVKELEGYEVGENLPEEFPYSLLLSRCPRALTRPPLNMFPPAARALTRFASRLDAMSRRVARFSRTLTGFAWKRLEAVLRCLSEWVSVLEERGTVPGTSLGGIFGRIQQFEMSLTIQSA